jgi:hypothetical protein
MSRAHGCAGATVAHRALTKHGTVVNIDGRTFAKLDSVINFAGRTFTQHRHGGQRSCPPYGDSL